MPTIMQSWRCLFEIQYLYIISKIDYISMLPWNSIFNQAVSASCSGATLH